MQLVPGKDRRRAMDLFASTAVLSRWDSEFNLRKARRSAESKEHRCELFLRQSFRRIRNYLAGLTDNDDKFILKAADSALG